MDENDGMTMQEALNTHICDLMATLDELDPISEEYRIVREAVISLSNVAIRIEEIQMRSNDEEAKMQHEERMKELELEAVRVAREAEQQLKIIEQKELKRWHTIDMGLRIATISVSVLSTIGFLGTAWVQTRANYVDNIYDVSPAARMTLTAIGNLIKPNIKT